MLWWNLNSKRIIVSNSTLVRTHTLYVSAWRTDNPTWYGANFKISHKLAHRCVWPPRQSDLPHYTPPPVYSLIRPNASFQSRYLPQPLRVQTVKHMLFSLYTQTPARPSARALLRSPSKILRNLHYGFFLFYSPHCTMVHVCDKSWSPNGNSTCYAWPALRYYKKGQK